MSDQVFESINPATANVFATTAMWSDGAVEKALEQAARLASSWARTDLANRCALLQAIADQLDHDRDRLAGLITAEMGKLTGEARAEVEKCASVCRYYAQHAEAFLADDPVETDAQCSLVAHQPLGAVLAVMPWNFPLWQVFRCAAPAVAAGNVVLLKHASNVMLCSAAIQDVFDRAGAPPGVFTQLPIRSPKVAELIADPRIAAVTLTGSEPAGRAVAAEAGKALKKSVLELGGSDPFLVLEDADLELAVHKAVQSRFMNAGQSCIAAKRFIVVDTIADAFEQKLAAAVAELRPGDPSNEQVTLAPMARADLREEIHAQVKDAIGKGAQLLTGGDVVDGPGFFYQPTVLTGIRSTMRAYSEELFGPVASVFRVRDEAQGIQLANDSPFGLGGSVWTQDRDRGICVARQLECGCAFVNELVKSDPRVPFGGVKSSGYGRELSRQGIREFINIKTIWVE
jgi:succinate-semialdehyde dehydrogenase/glutarate-semialdehyde dehydrogenase